MDDAALVTAVLAGDREAYGILYDRYAPLVRAVCHDATRNLAEAQDLAQDAFVRAYVSLAKLREPERFGRWVVGIARLRCQEWRRTRARERHEVLDPDSLMTAAEPADGSLEELRRAVAQLPETERLALHAFYLREESPEEARAALGLSRSGFYRALERARKRLARMLGCKQEGIQ